MPVFAHRNRLLVVRNRGKCNAQQIVHGEDFVGSEVEVAGDVALGEDVDDLGALGGGPDGAGEVIF